MNTYFKAVPKVLFRVLVEQHEMSQRFNVLKTISRLMGVFAGAITALVCLSSGISTFLTIPVIIITILVMDIILLAFGLKESTYKSKKFFKKHKTTDKTLDKYAFWLTIWKAVMISPILFNPNLLVFTGGFSFFLGDFVAYYTKYKPLFPIDLGRKTIWPDYHGQPGFDLSGNLTGNTGAVGGMSN